MEKGTGITALESARLYECSIRGWDTGVLATEKAWVGAQNCVFEENRVGLEFNSASASMSDADFEGNRFLRNGTAVSLLQVPQPVEMRFPRTIFSENEVDISNPAEHPVDTSESIFR